MLIALIVLCVLVFIAVVFLWSTYNRLILLRNRMKEAWSDIEVLSPKWFRDEMAEISKHMWNKYKNDK